MSAYILKPNGERIDVVPRARGGELNPSTFSLTEMQDIVGGYIQIVNLTDEVFMVVDEEGKFKDYDYNQKATEMVQKCFNTRDYIVGTVLVCSSDMIE